LSFEGEFYRFSLLPRTWSPGPIDVPDPPIYVAAVNPWMCRMVGEVADGVHVHPLHSVRYVEEVVRPNIEEGARAAGRDPAEVTVVCPLLTIVGDNDEERAVWRQRARFQLAFYGSTRTYASIFELHGWPGTSERLHDLQKQGALEDMAATITDDMLDVYTVTASWDGLADAIVERCAGVADRVICYFATTSWRDDPRSIDRWREVAGAVATAA
jgi:probable F420-dependent oxidoreductase